MGTDKSGLRFRSCRNCAYYKGYKHLMKKAKKRKRLGGAFFKMLVSIVVLHGMSCVTMSYLLAWMEHTQVVETVSSTIITEIVAPIIVYGFTKTVENIFEKNRLSFSEPVGAGKEDGIPAGAGESEG